MNMPGVPAGLLDNLPGVPHGFVEGVFGMLSSIQKEFVATLAEASKPDPRAKTHHTGVVVGFDPTGAGLGFSTVDVDLDGSGTVVTLPIHDGYGAGQEPMASDVVHVEFNGNVGWVTDRLRRP